MPTLMGKINIIARCARLYRNDKLKKYGIHGTMDSIIFHVCKSPGISQDELASRIYIDKSNVARKIAKLEKEGYITRKPGEKDRRVQMVYPEPKAQTLCDEIRCILGEWNSYVTEGMSEQDVNNALKILDTIYERSRKYSEEREADTQ